MGSVSHCDLGASGDTKRTRWAMATLWTVGQGIAHKLPGTKRQN